MVEHKQLNLRVPEAANDPLKDIAERIRKDAGFLARLRRFLDEDDGERSAFLAERLDRLERRMADLEAIQEVPIPVLPLKSKPARPVQDEMFPPADQGDAQDEAEPGSPVWARGEGKGRRLTDAGKAEFRRMADAGRSNVEIGEVLGITAYSAQRARVALAKKSAA